MNQKNKIILAIALFISMITSAQIGIGTPTPHASSALDITSTNKGVLVPRMTKAQRTGIVTPANGLQVYDTNTKSVWYYNGTTWNNTQNFVPFDSNGDGTPDALRLGSNSDGSDRAVENGIFIGDGINAEMGFNSTYGLGASNGYSYTFARPVGFRNNNFGIGSFHNVQENTISDASHSISFFGDVYSRYSNTSIEALTEIKSTYSTKNFLGTFAYQQAGSNLSFWTRPEGNFNSSGTFERLTILHNGNVGIGTNTPTAKLDVGGYVRVMSTDAQGDAAPQPGMIRYNPNSDGAGTPKFQGYVGAPTNAWVNLH